MMTGALKMNADFLTANKQGKLSEALAAPRIKEADVVSAAKRICCFAVIAGSAA